MCSTTEARVEYPHTAANKPLTFLGQAVAVDNGIGIEPRHYEQVFNMFHRLHSRLDYTGTGIGLAIVRKAALKLNGSVRVESKPGEGSTFFVALPRIQGNGEETHS